MDPDWLNPIMALRAAGKSGTLAFSKATRYLILDSSQARQYSLLAAMELVCGYPTRLDESAPSGQILLQNDERQTLETLTLKAV